MNTFEFWQHDKFSIEYMLDRCIIAKMIEETGNQVPDNFSIYYDGHYETADSADFFFSVDDYLSLSKIGRLKFRDREHSEYMGAISIRLHALEELAYYPLTSAQQTERANWMNDLESSHEMFDTATMEAECHIVGTCIFYSIHFAMGRASEFCDLLASVHHKATKMIKEIRQNLNKGERSDASHSNV